MLIPGKSIVPAAPRTEGAIDAQATSASDADARQEDSAAHAPRTITVAPALPAIMSIGKDVQPVAPERLSSLQQGDLLSGSRHDHQESAVAAAAAATDAALTVTVAAQAAATPAAAVAALPVKDVHAPTTNSRELSAALDTAITNAPDSNALHDRRPAQTPTIRAIVLHPYPPRVIAVPPVVARSSPRNDAHAPAQMGVPPTPPCAAVRASPALAALWRGNGPATRGTSTDCSGAAVGPIGRGIPSHRGLSHGLTMGQQNGRGHTPAHAMAPMSRLSSGGVGRDSSVGPSNTAGTILMLCAEYKLTRIVKKKVQQ